MLTRAVDRLPYDPRRDLLRLVAVLLACGAGLIACGGHSGPHSAGLPPGYVYGPGRIPYRWPPPSVRGQVDTATFCQLLVDDYEHLKTAQETQSAPAKMSVIEGYVDYAPTLQASAPTPIVGAVKTYVGAIAVFLRSYLAAGLDVYKMQSGQLAAISTAAVGAAAQQLDAFAAQQCHYDLAANSTPTG